MGMCNDFSLDEKGLHNMKASIVKAVDGHVRITHFHHIISLLYKPTRPFDLHVNQ